MSEKYFQAFFKALQIHLLSERLQRTFESKLLLRKRNNNYFDASLISVDLNVSQPQISRRLFLDGAVSTHLYSYFNWENMESMIMDFKILNTRSFAQPKCQVI